MVSNKKHMNINIGYSSSNHEYQWIWYLYDISLIIPSSLLQSVSVVSPYLLARSLHPESLPPRSRQGGTQICHWFGNMINPSKYSDDINPSPLRLVDHLTVFSSRAIDPLSSSQCERPELFVPLPSMRPVVAGKNYERKAFPQLWREPLVGWWWLRGLENHDHVEFEPIGINKYWDIRRYSIIGWW